MDLQDAALIFLTESAEHPELARSTARSRYRRAVGQRARRVLTR